MAAFAPRVIAQKTKVVVVALVILAVAFVCQMVAIATPGWLSTHDVIIGLFLYCGSLTTTLRTRSTGECNQIENLDIPGSLQAVRIMGVFSTGLVLTSFITGCLHLWTVVRHEKINLKYVTASLVAAFAAVLLTLVAAILFGADTRSAMPRMSLMVHYNLSYSYILYVMSGVLTVAGAVLVIATLRSLTRLLLV
ncbi:hypothetical protein RRG08_053994 [Elysia crispata]|uniref:Uncharacterized protein n=1 Tax=Elysia crispata TaxID=231223 RepID=A0AAE1EEC2_9GAST|nr:hypothetical protein RRG08_053994 [Elysia crispata]